MSDTPTGDPRGTVPPGPGDSKVVYLLAPKHTTRLAQAVWLLLTLILSLIVGYVLGTGMGKLEQDWQTRHRGWSTRDVRPAGA